MSRERSQLNIPQISGAIAHQKLLEDERLRELIRAAGNGKPVRVRLDHRKQHARQAHNTGVTLTIGEFNRQDSKEWQARLGTARSGPTGAFSSHHGGESANITCGGCGTVLSRRLEQLIRATVEAIAKGRSTATLT